MKFKFNVVDTSTHLLQPISRKGVICRSIIAGHEYKAHVQLFMDKDLGEAVCKTIRYRRPVDGKWKIVNVLHDYILPEEIELYLNAIERSECV